MAHHVFRFPNGYGASVLTPDPRGGDAELAVIRFHGPSDAYSLVYDTPITGDVRRLDGPEILPVLSAISAL